MAEAEASARAGADSDECLHCAIIDMVEERIADGSADAANLVVLIAESLVDVILLVPQAEQAQLMAHMLSALGDLFCPLITDCHTGTVRPSPRISVA
jgi:hypothetical protein